MERDSRPTGRGVASPLHDSVTADLIKALDRADFPYIGLQAISKLVPVDAGAVFVYRGDDLIYLALDQVLPLIGNRFAANYPTTYRFSPFFQHHRSGLPNGIYMMQNLARSASVTKPENTAQDIELDDEEFTGYRTKGWFKKAAELDIAVALGPQTTAQIALYRLDASSFDPRELAVLRGMSQTLYAAFEKFWQRHELRYASGVSAVSKALQSLCTSSLTQRENAVVQSILNGAEGREIAEKLQISEETVKTHRKKAYGKLGVKTKHELLQEISRMIVTSSAGPAT